MPGDEEAVNGVGMIKNQRMSIPTFFFRYKEFCIHSANVHGGLVEVLLRDGREELRSMAPKFKAIRARIC